MPSGRSPNGQHHGPVVTHRPPSAPVATSPRARSPGRSCGDRRVRPQQPLVLELVPHRARDRTSGTPRGCARTCAALRAPGMTEATLGCPSGNWSAAAASGTPWRSQTAWMRPTRSLTAGFAGRVVGVGARTRARGQDPRLVGGTDDEADALLDARGELRIQHLLVEQGVGHRDEEEVERRDVQEPRDEVQLVDARADAPDEPAVPELADGPPATRGELGQEALVPEPQCRDTGGRGRG